MTFDPRRAEPGQTFEYTGSTEHIAGPDDEIPAGATFLAPEDGDEPGQRRYRIDGVQKRLHADENGVVHPKSEEDERILNLFDLPVAQKAKAEEKKASEAPDGKKE